jgi:hypothetical protein
VIEVAVVTPSMGDWYGSRHKTMAAAIDGLRHRAPQIGYERFRIIQML